MTREEFREKYGIKATFEDMQKVSGFLKYSGEAMVPTSATKSVAQMQYTMNLKFMFRKFMEVQASLKDREFIKDSRDIKLEDFVKDFESVMSAESPNEERKPYEGLEFEAIDTIKETAKEYTEEIETIIKNDIKRGAPLSNYSKKTAPIAENAGYDARREHKNAVCTMYKAMKQVIGERTWRDRINPLNWFGMIAENLYMRNLKKQVKDIARKDSPEIFHVRKLKHTDFEQYEYYQEAKKNQKEEIERRIDTFASDNTLNVGLIEEYHLSDLDTYKNNRMEEVTTDFTVPADAEFYRTETFYRTKEPVTEAAETTNDLKKSEIINEASGKTLDNTINI